MENNKNGLTKNRFSFFSGPSAQAYCSLTRKFGIPTRIFVVVEISEFLSLAIRRHL